MKYYKIGLRLLVNKTFRQKVHSLQSCLKECVFLKKPWEQIRFLKRFVKNVLSYINIVVQFKLTCLYSLSKSVLYSCSTNWYTSMFYVSFNWYLFPYFVILYNFLQWYVLKLYVLYLIL
jgi:hypothetical protein